MPKKMNARQQNFVAAYLSGKSGVEAARIAGYSAGAARTRSTEMLHHNPLTMAAIKEGQEKLRVDANYNAERAMKELDDAIAFAVKTGNANAYANCVRQKCELSGLLDAKKSDKNTPFQINIVGVDVAAPSGVKVSANG
jgi:phage terminase small subunit